MFDIIKSTTPHASLYETEKGIHPVLEEYVQRCACVGR